MEGIETKKEQKNTGLVYLTDNDNMFIAPDGISQEEQNRLSLEVDRDVLLEKLAKIEAELKALPKEEHKEEIERDEPYEEPQTEHKGKEEAENQVLESSENNIIDPSTLPDFTVQTKDGPKLFKDMKVVFQD